MLRENGEVEISQLSRFFGVTEMTIRRDLEQLVHADKAVRTHGGAMLAASPIHAASAQTVLNKESKLAIARKALFYIKDGTTVFFDSGSTGHILAQCVPASSHLTALSNSVTIVSELVSRSFVSVIMIGGELKADTLSCRGPAAEEALSRFRVDFAFVSVSAVGKHGELFTGSLAEAGFKRKILAAAQQSMVLADSSKIGRQSLCRFADARETLGLITDGGLGAEQLAVLEQNGAHVIIAK
jgi:DeoR family transcriptional regulator of aga operon/DeoR family fructose operon transcriptional repressor